MAAAAGATSAPLQYNKCTASATVLLLLLAVWTYLASYMNEVQNTRPWNGTPLAS